MKYKKSVLIILLVTIQNVWSQTNSTNVQTKTINIDNIPIETLSDEKVQKYSEISKADIEKNSNNQITKDELDLLDVEIVEQNVSEAQTPLLIKPSETSLVDKLIDQEKCIPLQKQDNILQFVQDVTPVIGNPEPKKKRYIYFTWGYNRNFHSKSDATFETKDGTFTIHDAIGYDRPSYNWKDYVYPNRLPIPQYNLRVGYELNDKWDIVIGLDHMKWVFQSQFKYEVTGDYNHTVFVPADNGDPAMLQGLTFDQVKETGDMRWLYFDHTNGYNYVHVGGIYKNNLFTSKNNNWKIDTGIGFGAGLMVPQTTVKYHQDSWWNWKGVDNQFHVAGFGGHAEAKLQLGYKNFFVEPVVRGTYIKINNALVQQSGEKLSHTPIGSIQFIVQAGYKIPIKYREKRMPAGALNN